MTRIRFILPIIALLMAAFWIAAQPGGPATAAPLMGFTPQPPGTATPTPSPATQVGIVPAGPTNFDPALAKSADPQEAEVGDLVTFTITITNPNNQTTLSNVVFQDTLAPQFDFVSGSTTSGFLWFDEATRTIFVHISPMAPLEVAVVTIITRVNELGVPPNVLRNVAHADNNGRRVSSNEVTVQVIPSFLPEAGYAGGNNPIAIWAIGLLALVFVVTIIAGRRLLFR